MEATHLPASLLYPIPYPFCVICLSFNLPQIIVPDFCFIFAPFNFLISSLLEKLLLYTLLLFLLFHILSSTQRVKIILKLISLSLLLFLFFHILINTLQVPYKLTLSFTFINIIYAQSEQLISKRSLYRFFIEKPLFNKIVSGNFTSALILIFFSSLITLLLSFSGLEHTIPHKSFSIAEHLIGLAISFQFIFCV